VRRNSFRFHSSSRRSLTLYVRAARARTRLGNPSARQMAALRSALKTTACTGPGTLHVIRRMPSLIDIPRECRDLAMKRSAIVSIAASSASDGVGSESLLKAAPAAFVEKGIRAPRGAQCDLLQRPAPFDEDGLGPARPAELPIDCLRTLDNYRRPRSNISASVDRRESRSFKPPNCWAGGESKTLDKDFQFH